MLSRLRLKRSLLWALALAGLSAGLCFVPLFSLLGYEFCLALALAASLAAAHLGSVWVAHARASDEGMMLSLTGPVRATLTLLGRGAAAAALLLALPLGLICLNALRVRNCDLAEGLSWFVMLPLLSAALAAGVGGLWALVIPRPALATLATMLTLAASLAWGLWRFYDAPAIFGYDPFVGYFAGALYDEDVSIGWPFVASRLYNLAWLLGLMLVAALALEPAALRLRPRLAWRRLRARPLLALAPALCLACGVTLFALRGPLGWSVDADHVRADLGGVRHTPHFTIHYPREMKPAEVELLAQDHEFRHAQLEAFFGTAPRRLTSYIFRSAAHKRALMGAGRTFIAKPWRREVYLQHAPFPHPVLKHELAHVFAGMHGDALFGISLRWRWRPLPHPLFNVGLIEGVAVAADWRSRGELTVHQRAAVLFRTGLAPPMRSLMGAGFLTHAPRRSYTLAGSFCRYLAQQHGVARLNRAFGAAGDFAAVYGRPLDQLLRQWRTWLARVKVPEDQLRVAKERFLRPSLFRRVCGHEVANRLALAAELSARSEFDQAAREVAQVCEFDPGNPEHLLRQASYLSAAGRLPTAMDAVRRFLAHPAITRPKQRRGMELLGDLYWLRRQPLLSAEWYGRAASRVAAPFGRRVLHLKRWALTRPAPVRDVVMRYLVPPPGSPRDGSRDVHLSYRLHRLLQQGKRGRSGGLGLYLVGKQLAGHDHCALATGPLAEALRQGLPNKDFELEARLTLARCQYIAADLQGVHATAAALLATSELPAATALRAHQWLARVAWRRTGKLPASKGAR